MEFYTEIQTISMEYFYFRFDQVTFGHTAGTDLQWIISHLREEENEDREQA